MTRITMNAPAGASAVSHGGETYTVKRGAVEVPAEAVEDLLFHGFTVSDKPAKADKPVPVEPNPDSDPDSPE